MDDSPVNSSSQSTNELLSPKSSEDKMKQRITDILAGLNDENNIQPIVYNLFEEANPEEIKKTIENLQRTLEYKSEEVKKTLSANHEHLFSCSDLVEQLKDFVTESGDHLEKIKNLNSRLEESARTSAAVSISSQKLSYSIHQEMFVTEYMEFVMTNFLHEHPYQAVQLFFYFLQQKEVQRPQILNSVKLYWIRILKKVVAQYKECLFGKRELSLPLMTALLQLLSLPETSSLGFSNFQGQAALFSAFKLKPSRETQTVFPESQALSWMYGLIKSLLTTGKQVDIIDILKSAIFIDSSINSGKFRAQVEPKEEEDETGSCTATSIVSQTINLSIGHFAAEPEQKQSRIQEWVMKMVQQTTDLQEDENIQTHSLDDIENMYFVNLYKEHVGGLISSVSLYDTPEASSPSALLSSIPPPAFNFAFLKRYSLEKTALTFFETSCGLSAEHRLSALIASNWKAYREAVLSHLRQSLSLEEISLEEVSALSQLEDLLDRAAEARKAFEGVLTGERLRQEGLDLVEGLDESPDSKAEENVCFGDVLKQALEKLLEKGQRAEDSLTKWKSLFLAYLIASDQVLTQEEGLKQKVRQVIQSTLKEAKPSPVSVLSSLAESLHSDYRQPSLGAFFSESLGQTVLVEDMVKYPRVFPFKIGQKQLEEGQLMIGKVLEKIKESQKEADRVKKPNEKLQKWASKVGA